MYVGYSMRDFDLRESFGSNTFANGTYEKWVSPFPDSIRRGVRRRVQGVKVAGEREAGTYRKASHRAQSDIFLSELAARWPAVFVSS